MPSNRVSDFLRFEIGHSIRVNLMQETRPSSLQRLHSQKIEQRCTSVSRVQCRDNSAAFAGREAATTGVSGGTGSLSVRARAKTSLPSGEPAMPASGPTFGSPGLNLGRFRQPKPVRARRTGRGGTWSANGKSYRVTTPKQC